MMSQDKNNGTIIDALFKQIELAYKHQDAPREQLLCIQIAEIYYGRCQYKQAFDFYQRAYKITGRTNNEFICLYTLVGSGRASIQLNEFTPVYWTEALDLARSLPHQQFERECLGNLSEIYLSTNPPDPQRALTYAHQAFLVANDLPMKIVALNYIALAHRQLGNIENALASREKAFILISEYNTPSDLQALHLAGIGKDLLSLGQIKQAIPKLRQALHIYLEQDGHKQHAIKTLRYLAQAALLQQPRQYSEALRLLKQAARLVADAPLADASFLLLKSVIVIDIQKLVDHLDQSERLDALTIANNLFLPPKNDPVIGHRGLRVDRGEPQPLSPDAETRKHLLSLWQDKDHEGFDANIADIIKAWYTDQHRLACFFLELGMVLAGEPGDQAQSLGLAYVRLFITLIAPLTTSTILLEIYTHNYLEKLRHRWKTSTYKKAWSASEPVYKHYIDQIASLEETD